MKILHKKSPWIHLNQPIYENVDKEYKIKSGIMGRKKKKNIIHQPPRENYDLNSQIHNSNPFFHPQFSQKSSHSAHCRNKIMILKKKYIDLII